MSYRYISCLGCHSPSTSAFVLVSSQVVPSPVVVFQRRLYIPGLVSSRVQTTSASFPCTHSIALHSLPWWYYFPKYVFFISVWPHVHRHIFISVLSSFVTWELVMSTVSIPYSIWNHLVDMFLNIMYGCILLSHS